MIVRKATNRPISMRFSLFNTTRFLILTPLNYVLLLRKQLGLPIGMCMESTMQELQINSLVDMPMLQAISVFSI